MCNPESVTSAWSRRVFARGGPEQVSSSFQASPPETHYLGTDIYHARHYGR